MRRRLREVGRIETPRAAVQLRMTVGVHSGRDAPVRRRGVAPGADRRRARRHGDAGRRGGGASPGRSSSAWPRPPRCPRAASGTPCEPGPPAAARAAGRAGHPRRPQSAGRSTPNCLPAASRPRCAATCWPGRRPPSTVRSRPPSCTSTGVDGLIAREGADAAAQALHELVGRVQRACRRARRLLPEHRHRPRRRQADPHRRAARARPATTRSGCCWRRGRSSRSDGPLRRLHRRQPRQGLRRRHRPALPPHLHRDGRRGEPRRPAHGQGAARPGLRDRVGAGPLRDALRDDGARAVHGEGQVAAR